MGACPTSWDATKSHKAGVPSKFPNVLLNNSVEFWEILLWKTWTQCRAASWSCNPRFPEISLWLKILFLAWEIDTWSLGITSAEEPKWSQAILEGGYCKQIQVLWHSCQWSFCCLYTWTVTKTKSWSIRYSPVMRVVPPKMKAPPWRKTRTGRCKRLWTKRVQKNEIYVCT